MPGWTPEDPHWEGLRWLTPAGAPSGERYTRDTLHVGHRQLSGDIELVVVVGPLDMSTSAGVGDLVRERLRPGHQLLIDLRGVTFFGSSALTMLVDAETDVARAGGRVVLVADDRVVLRPIEALGVGDMFEIVDSIDRAVTGGV